MRPVREVTAEQENFRLDRSGPFALIRRDPVKPEPEGTIVLVAFRITGYDRDCDGSLMGRLENIDSNGEPTGWEQTHIGIRPESKVVVTLKEWKSMFAASRPAPTEPREETS